MILRLLQGSFSIAVSYGEEGYAIDGGYGSNYSDGGFGAGYGYGSNSSHGDGSGYGYGYNIEGAGYGDGYYAGDGGRNWRGAADYGHYGHRGLTIEVSTNGMIYE